MCSGAVRDACVVASDGGEERRVQVARHMRRGHWLNRVRREMCSASAGAERDDGDDKERRVQVARHMRRGHWLSRVRRRERRRERRNERMKTGMNVVGIVSGEQIAEHIPYERHCCR